MVGDSIRARVVSSKSFLIRCVLLASALAAGCGLVVIGKSVASASVPTADMYAIPTTGPAPLLVTFDGSSTTGHVTSWTLDFGDGSPDQKGRGKRRSPTATHVYSSAGHLHRDSHGERRLG